MKGIIGGYLIAGKLPKADFKKLTRRVIDFDKGITIIFNQCLASKPFKFHRVGRNLFELVLIQY